MTKVKSIDTVSFPQYDWGITKGEEAELPEDKEAQAVILAHPSIIEVGSKHAEKPADNKK